MRFKIDWASLIVGRKFTVFALFYFVLEGNFQVHAPGRGLYLEERFNGGFLVLRVWGTYIWRGLYMERPDLNHQLGSARDWHGISTGPKPVLQCDSSLDDVSPASRFYLSFLVENKAGVELRFTTSDNDPPDGFRMAPDMTSIITKEISDPSDLSIHAVIPGEEKTLDVNGQPSIVVAPRKAAGDPISLKITGKGGKSLDCFVRIRTLICLVHFHNHFLCRDFTKNITTP